MTHHPYPKDWHRCAMCDEWYDPRGERARIHEHPEPQSGPFRDAHMKSRLSYERWIEETPEGREWVKHRQALGFARGGLYKKWCLNDRSD